MKKFVLFILLLLITFESISNSLPDGFVYLDDIDKSISQKMDFATENNCIGERLDGYEGTRVICTTKLAKELQKVQISLKMMNKDYSLQVLDAYRPARAVEHIKKWANDVQDQKTKKACYPDIDKKNLPGKYIAAGKSSHSRGSTVDVIIINIATNKSLDFGPDFFGEAANINYSGLTKQQKENRMLLRKVMLQHEFKPYNDEYWHFTLKEEPFSNKYFDFIIE